MALVYLAAPLFNLIERRANRAIAKRLQDALPGVEILLPQDFKYHGKFNSPTHFGHIYRECVDGIRKADCLLAWLDGPEPDSGACFEVGFAAALGKPIVGVRTDYRQNQEHGLNIMLSRGVTRLVFRPAFDEDPDALTRDVARALKVVLKLKGA